MLSFLSCRLQPALWPDGPSIGGAPAPALTAGELQATKKAVSTYQEQQTKGVTKEVQAEASKDLVALSKESTLSSSERAQVESIRDKVAAGKPLTDADLKQLQAVVDKLATRIQAPPAPGAPAPAPAPVAGKTAATFDHTTSKKFLEEGTHAYKGGNYAGAEYCFRHALATSDPDNSEVQATLHYDLARAMQKQGRKDDAVMEYNAYLHASPNAKDADAVKAQIKKLGGEVRPPAPEAERVAQRHFNTAKLMMISDLHTEAAKNFRLALRDTPPGNKDTVATMHYDLAVALEKQGNKEEAVQELNAALHANPKIDNADQIRDKIKALGGEVKPLPPADQQASQYHFELGRSLYNGGHNAEAEQHFRQALKDLPPGTKDVAPELHYDLAQVLNNQGKKDEAIAEYEAVLKNNPSDEVANLARAKLKELGKQNP